MSRTIALLALSGAAIAQKTITANLLVLGWDDGNIAASIVGADSTMTTYAINCIDDDPAECGLPNGGTIAQGESSLSMMASYENESFSFTVTNEYNCKLDPAKDEASCTAREDATERGVKSSTSTFNILSEYSAYISPVPVTAGADKLSADPGATTTAAPETTAAVPETSGGASKTAETGASTTGQATPTADPDGAAASLKISVFGILAVVGGALALF